MVFNNIKLRHHEFIECTLHLPSLSSRTKHEKSLCAKAIRKTGKKAKKHRNTTAECNLRFLMCSSRLGNAKITNYNGRLKFICFCESTNSSKYTRTKAQSKIGKIYFHTQPLTFRTVVVFLHAISHRSMQIQSPSPPLRASLGALGTPFWPLLAPRSSYCFSVLIFCSACDVLFCAFG